MTGRDSMFPDYDFYEEGRIAALVYADMTTRERNIRHTRRKCPYLPGPEADEWQQGWNDVMIEVSTFSVAD